MTQPEQERFDESLDVSSNRLIQGAVAGGATVRSGCTLTIQGAAAGHFIVEGEAILNIQGTLSATFQNAGTVLIAGVITGGLPSTGTVVVAVGSVLAARGARILRASGFLEPVDHVENVDVDASRAGYLAYDPKDGSFHPRG